MIILTWSNVWLEIKLQNSNEKFWILTTIPFKDTQQSGGKSCRRGTRNCRHPSQWHSNNIMPIRLKILTTALARSYVIWKIWRKNTRRKKVSGVIKDSWFLQRMEFCWVTEITIMHTVMWHWWMEQWQLKIQLCHHKK